MIAAVQSPWNGKFSWLIIPSLLGALGWWWGMSQFVSGQVNITTNAVQNVSRPAVIAILGLGLWLGAGLLTTYLSPQRRVRWVVAAAISLPLLAFFPLTLWTLVAVVATGAGLAWAFDQTFADSHNRLTVQPFQTLNVGLSSAVVAALVAVSVLSYQQVRGNEQSHQATLARLSESMVTLTEQFLPSIYHGYQPTMTVDQLIGSQLPDADTILNDIHFDQLANQAAKQQALNQKIEHIGLDPNQIHLDLRQDTAALRVQLSHQLATYRQKAIDQARDKLSQQLGLTVSGTEAVHQALTDLVSQKLSTAFGRYVSVIPIILAIGVFLLLRLFSFLYTWVILGFGWSLYRFLRLSKIVSLETTTVPAQHLEWRR